MVDMKVLADFRIPSSEEIVYYRIISKDDDNKPKRLHRERKLCQDHQAYIGTRNPQNLRKFNKARVAPRSQLICQLPVDFLFCGIASCLLGKSCAALG